MWVVSNSWNNFAPFSGFMLKGYEKRGSLQSVGEDIDEPIGDARAKCEMNGHKADQASSRP